MSKEGLFIIIVALLVACGHRCGHKQVENTAITDSEWTPERLYYRQTDTIDKAWNDTTAFFHHWKVIKDKDYLFGAPSHDSVAKWKSICEELNTPDGYNRISAQYKTMNQYVTLQDFRLTWQDKSRCLNSPSFKLWRLEQFRTDTLTPTTLRSRFEILEKATDELLDYDPFFPFEYDELFGLSLIFQKLRNYLLFDEIIKRSSSDVAQALKNEANVWQFYHAAMDSTYRVLTDDPDGWNGNVWGQAIMQAQQADEHVYQKAIEDYCYSISDSFEQEKHVNVPESKVEKEYRKFMKSLKDNEYHHPVSVRHKALTYEMNQWKKWMRSRESVSALLSGEPKKAYDNATNNVRRMKYIILKNRYEGYGVISNDVIECLMPFTVPDEELDAPSFDEKWKKL